MRVPASSPGRPDERREQRRSQYDRSDASTGLYAVTAREAALGIFERTSRLQLARQLVE